MPIPAATPAPPAPPGSTEPERRVRAAFAAGPVVAAMAALAVLLTATSQWYGFHRDELYFRMLDPAWGYVDQPPLTPFLARTLTGTVDEPWMLRTAATLAAVAGVLVLALIARETGGGRRAQALVAWGGASGAFPLVFGHTLLTSTLDLVVWPLVALFAIRAVLRAEPRWWLVVGVVAGLSTYNKLLVVVLLAGFALGLLVFGPRSVFRSPWLWAGVGVAAVLALPNLAYQVANDWPQLRMGAALGDENGGEVRVAMWPFLLVLVGPLLVPIWVAGIVAPFRRAALRGIRFVVVALPVVVLFTYVGGAQSHYPLGIVEVLLAIGCVPAAEWMRTHGRAALVWAAVAVNGAVSAVIALPIVPPPALGATPVPSMNEAAADSVGWPEYVAQIATAVRAGPPGTVVVTSNYGEAGAVARYGPEAGIDDVAYSGHNALHDQARPPADARSAVFVGGIGPIIRGSFDACAQQTTLENAFGVDNEERGQEVWLCTGMTTTWAELWPRLAHLD